MTIHTIMDNSTVLCRKGLFFMARRCSDIPQPMKCPESFYELHCNDGGSLQAYNIFHGFLADRPVYELSLYFRMHFIYYHTVDFNKYLNLLIQTSQYYVQHLAM